MINKSGNRLLVGMGVFAISLITVPEARGTASIVGVVELGDPPRRQRAVKRYSAGRPNPEAKPERPPAVVYLEGTFSDSGEAPLDGRPRMLQKNLQFVPAVLPVLVGTTVAFPNEDSVYHNVFSYASTRSFDLGRYRGTEGAPTVTFDTPGAVSVFCEIHSHMRSVILVLESPYFTVTDAGGTYRLKDLPAGAYVLKAWVNEKTEYSAEVTLKEGETLEVDFTKP